MQSHFACLAFSLLRIYGNFLFHKTYQKTNITVLKIVLSLRFGQLDFVLLYFVRSFRVG